MNGPYEVRFHCTCTCTCTLLSYFMYHVYYRSHSDFNSREVGQNLAKTILSTLDPTSLLPAQTDMLKSDTPTLLINNKRLIPHYVQPKITYTQLPGTCITTWFIHVHVHVQWNI